MSRPVAPRAREARRVAGTVGPPSRLSRQNLPICAASFLQVCSLPLCLYLGAKALALSTGYKEGSRRPRRSLSSCPIAKDRAFHTNKSNTNDPGSRTLVRPEEPRPARQPRAAAVPCPVAPRAPAGEGAAPAGRPAHPGVPGEVAPAQPHLSRPGPGQCVKPQPGFILTSECEKYAKECSFLLLR